METRMCILAPLLAALIVSPAFAQEPPDPPEAAAEVVAEEMVAEVTLADLWAGLNGAITSEASNAVSVEAAGVARDAAAQTLAEARAAYAAAMEGQEMESAGVTAAAQALVDFLTSAFLSP